MLRNITEYRCLLISPSDVLKEREAIVQVVRGWNGRIGSHLGIRLELVDWESHSTPVLQDTAQEVLNQQIVADADLGIAVFWTRLGSPTKEYPSGSLEEIERLRISGKRVLVYFCDRPIPQERLRDDQYVRLEAERKTLEGQGLIDRYESVDQLAAKVSLHISSTISMLTSVDTELSVAREGSAAKLTFKNAQSAQDDEFLQRVAKAGCLKHIALGFCMVEYYERDWIAFSRSDYRNLMKQDHPADPDLICWPDDGHFSGDGSPVWIFAGRRTQEIWRTIAWRVEAWQKHPESVCVFALFDKVYQRPEFHVVPAAVIGRRVSPVETTPERLSGLSEANQRLLKSMRTFTMPEGFLEGWHLLGGRSSQAKVTKSRGVE